MILPATGPIALKIPGKTTKMRPGPWDGDTPCENTKGKIKRPAKNATIVSVNTTRPAELTILSFLERYDPKVINAPIPKDNEKKDWPSAEYTVLMVIRLKSGTK